MSYERAERRILLADCAAQPYSFRAHRLLMAEQTTGVVSAVSSRVNGPLKSCFDFNIAAADRSKLNIFLFSIESIDYPSYERCKIFLFSSPQLSQLADNWLIKHTSDLRAHSLIAG